ncbi:gamma-glutamyl-gamma-aminobutyrate hydrolase family protein [Rhodobacter sp. Har01]|uniref:glutamine amidotransferase-related protein n=1 Tax=Rhodobacter sp. Har01 TaxID=2883999 RepID=UPI001D05CA32|nr:gamma-glutamyl-gamma-aminobutyrate hydrolase family protein [Rhodobacter sp. Har01]MCB6179453.1 gamma-glutamyl-gamma-aminobutyrate hydrolase family protein [Rhodobacter sp. Har01]
MAPDLVFIRHGDEPDDDRVHSFALMNGFRPVTYRPFRGDALPRPTADLAGTVVFGGKQSAEDDDGCAYLAEELRWITDCMAANIPILGICLGAQLIIRALGGRVGPHDGELHEFGYYPVTPTAAGKGFMPGPMHVTEAHYHTFTLPDGVELLATGTNYVNQAFRFGDRVFGVQFHPECTIEIFRRWQDADWAPYGKPGVQDRDEQTRLMARHDAAQSAWFNGFLARLFCAGAR